MSNLAIAILLSLNFSILIWVIELNSSVEKSKFKTFLCLASIVYLTVLSIGNIATTLAAASLIDSTIEPQSSSFLNNYKWFWYAFFGVFSFEAIFQNMNLTFFDKSVLTFNDWINKARDSAVARIIEKSIEAETDAIQSLSSSLAELEMSVINTHIIDILGSERLNGLEEMINQNPGIDPKLIKAKALAQDAFAESSSIIKGKNK